MKIALITDTHFGARGDSEVFHDFFERYYRGHFFPELRARGIEQVIHLGDAFDRRKYSNHYTLSRCKEYFFQQFARFGTSLGAKLDLIVGNHDIFHKNTLHPNTGELVIGNVSIYNVSIIDHPTYRIYDGLKVLLIPWICEENQADTFKLMRETNATVLFGHLELKGFEMYKGIPQETGLNVDEFLPFDLVCSGHYHTKSKRGNIHYLGCPYEMTWSDYGDPKGFHVFDTETLELEFVENPFTIFEKLDYTPGAFPYLPAAAGKYVKLLVSEKDEAFDESLKALEEVAINVQVVESRISLESDVTDNEMLEAEDTLSLIHRYIEGSEIRDKEKTFALIRDLHAEALSAE